jgi:lipopolysaccharide export LptBFGC system permease protein LptF
MSPILGLERPGLWIAVAAALIFLGAAVALLESRRTRTTLVAVVGAIVAFGLVVYFGYFLFFSGD